MIADLIKLSIDPILKIFPNKFGVTAIHDEQNFVLQTFEEDDQYPGFTGITLTTLINHCNRVIVNISFVTPLNAYNLLNIYFDREGQLIIDKVIPFSLHKN